MCIKQNYINIVYGFSALVALSDSRPTGDQEVAGSTTAGWQHSFIKIDHEIFSMVILTLPLIKKGSCQFVAKEYAQYCLTV